ncbi:hypothetical protein ANN_20402 [Periplaneta americana]|uniref:Ig-like domain-containing protein n=1 Tax=Periplaneta americana TaxID=6978 RepID=A0ABQ8SDT4_PERAM|nr:hypothetical protein ANN_20402 [Periplaneta americana]
MLMVNNLCAAVAPVVKVPNQLLGAPLGTDVQLECYVEAFPNTINYWVKNRGEMLLDGRTHRHDTTVYDVIRLLIPAPYKNQSDSLMAANGDCHHLCKLMAPVRHRWSINDVIGGIRNTVMPRIAHRTTGSNRLPHYIFVKEYKLQQYYSNNSVIFGLFFCGYKRRVELSRLRRCGYKLRTRRNDRSFFQLFSQCVSQSKQARLVCRSSTRVCVRICVSIRRPEFECSGPQLEGPEFECSGPQLEGPEFEYSELSLKICGSRYLSGKDKNYFSLFLSSEEKQGKAVDRRETISEEAKKNSPQFMFRNSSHSCHYRRYRTYR